MCFGIINVRRVARLISPDSVVRVQLRGRCDGVEGPGNQFRVSEGRFRECLARREADVASFQRRFNNGPQGLQSSCPSGEKRVAREHKKRSMTPHCVDLVNPHISDDQWRLDDFTDPGFRKEGVLLPVVQAPMRGELRNRSCGGFNEIRDVRIHQAGIVFQPVLGYQRRRLPRGLPQCGAMPLWRNAEATEHGKRQIEVGAFIVELMFTAVR